MLAIYLPNVLEYPIIFYGVAFLGGVSTTVNPLYTAKELERQLRIAGAKYVVTIPPLVENAKDAAASTSVTSLIVLGEAQGCESLSSLLSDDGSAFPEHVHINTKKDVVALPFSSGTTGLSKGVMITHLNLVSGLAVLTDNNFFPDDAVILNLLPFYHIYALLVMMGGCLDAGCKLVLLSRFEPVSFLKAIQDFKVCFTSFVPSKLSETVDCRLMHSALLQRSVLCPFRYLRSVLCP